MPEETILEINKGKGLQTDPQNQNDNVQPTNPTPFQGPSQPQPINQPQNPYVQNENPQSPVPQPVVQPTSPLPVAPPLAPQSVQPPGERGMREKFSKKILFLILGLIGVVLVGFIIISLLSHRSRSPVSSGNVALSYWGFDDENEVAKVLNGFEKENPTIKVTYTKQDSSDYIAKLKTRIPQGNGPDIFSYHNTWFPSVNSYLLPLPSSVISGQEFSQKYYEAAKKDLIRGGAIYGIPQNIDTLGLFINTDLFTATDQASLAIPKTWQDFVDVAASLTKRDDQGKIIQGGAGIGTYDNVSHAGDLVGLLFNQNEVQYSNFSTSTDRISQALTFYTDFAQVENNVWDDHQDNSLTAFEQGRLAMYFGYSSDLGKLESQSPTLKFKVVPVPQLNPDSPENVASYFVTGISLKTAHQQAATQFVKYLTEHNFADGISADSSISSSDPNKSVFIEEAKTATSSPFATVMGDPDFSGALVSDLRSSINSILSGGEADSEATNLITGYTNVISSLTSRGQSK